MIASLLPGTPNDEPESESIVYQKYARVRELIRCSQEKKQLEGDCVA